MFVLDEVEKVLKDNNGSVKPIKLVKQKVEIFKDGISQGVFEADEFNFFLC